MSGPPAHPQQSDRTEPGQPDPQRELERRARLDALGSRLRRLWATAMLASLAVFAVSLLAALLYAGPVPDLLVQVVVGAIIPPWFCIGGLFAGAVIRRGQLPGPMIAAMVASLLAAAGTVWLSMAALMQTPVDAVVAYKVVVTLGVAGLGGPIAALLATSARRERPLVVTRRIILTSAGITAAAVLLIMWSRWWQSRTFILLVVSGIGAVATVLSGLGLVVVSFVVKRQNRLAEGGLSGRSRIDLRCPECGEQQSMPTGISRCEGCGITIIVDFEEPRCECGYLLFRLAGDHCPECGKRVEPPLEPHAA